MWAQQHSGIPLSTTTHLPLPSQALNVSVVTASCTCRLSQERDRLVANTDPSKGPVFRPSKADYKDTFTKGAKDSKDRTQYETGVWVKNAKPLPASQPRSSTTDSTF